MSFPKQFSSNVRIPRSALPLGAGWCGDDKHKQTPLALRKSFISHATNCGPLSATFSSGDPCIANKSRRAVIVELALVEDIGMTSIHLDFASTTIGNIPPLKGPAKSTCKRCQGRVGQMHGLFTFKGVLQWLA